VKISGIGRAALLAGALAVGGALVPTAASAATPSDQGQAVKLTQPSMSTKSYGSCPRYRFCGWKGGNATGKGFKTKYSQPRLGKYGFYHNISSVNNRTKKVICIYPKTGYKGHFKGYSGRNVWIKAHTKGNLGQFNNKIGSFKLAKYGSRC